MKKRIWPEPTENARRVLESRYLLRNEKGELIEDIDRLFHRVASAVASCEKSDRKKIQAQFFELMRSFRFLPNSPTLMNAGKKDGQLSACFVLPVEDQLGSIFETLKDAALIHQSGGGTGFSFSRLRSKGSAVNSGQGVASGPVSFLKIFDSATETIKQGGTRRGANMGVLRVDHPDVMEFVDSKRSEKSIANFNISVGITDRFMQAVDQNQDFELLDPRTDQVVSRVSAKKIWDELTLSAWACGDPGVVFLDRMNFFNPTPEEGEFESTNPCGEQPLLAFESCNLGSINLGAYVVDGIFDEHLFVQDVHLALRFLDNVISINTFPVAESRKITEKNRKVGLGVMGFADALLRMGIRYDSAQARGLGERWMGLLDREAKKASVALAKKRGPFPNWKKSLWKDLGYKPMRNATVSTVAPTGTISMIAGCSSGIEPIFSAVFRRNVLDGQNLLDFHPPLQALLQEKGIAFSGNEDAASIDKKVREVFGSAWNPGYEVSVDGHVQMQAIFQRFSDSAVSKTINLKKEATVEDVRRAYQMAFNQGCKGITVYRDGSRGSQVLVNQVN
ncbi:MAG: adenosylcobalamin-dependent ribonucleoside-diphosphate reductase [Bdellovibrionales bacterium]|nr:adenosylcobalamin-dependent ribonucleoside-diphosphate reductase [Bdellovibrionales bacterium]